MKRIRPSSKRWWRQSRRFSRRMMPVVASHSSSPDVLNNVPNIPLSTRR
jgi:hypothetical protein